MNWLRLVTVLLFGLVSQPTQAQWRLLYRIQDIITATATPVDTANPITLIESRGTLSKYLIVRYAHTRRQLVAKDSVWGITDSTGAIWRSYDRELYRIIGYTSNGVSYAIPRYQSNRNPRPILNYALAYSRTLTSKIKSTWRDAMNDVPPGFILHSSRK